jgi:hypothetical protein
MTGNVVICEVDALKYVVLGEEKERVPYKETVCTTECITLWAKCRTNPGRYNQFELYMQCIFTLHFLRYISALSQRHFHEDGSIGVEICRTTYNVKLYGVNIVPNKFILLEINKNI